MKREGEEGERGNTGKESAPREEAGKARQFDKNIQNRKIRKDK